MDGMFNSADPFPLKFFTNLGCPSFLTADEAKAVEVHLIETAKDSIEGTVAEEQG